MISVVLVIRFFFTFDHEAEGGPSICGLGQEMAVSIQQNLKERTAVFSVTKLVSNVQEHTRE